MVGFGLGHQITPFGFIQVDIFPLGFAQFSGADEQQRRKPQSTLDRKRPGKPFKGPQHFRYLGGVSNGGEMLFNRGRYRAQQVFRRVILCAAGCNRVAEYLTDLVSQPMRRIPCPTAINTTQDHENFRSINFSDRAFPQPRKHILFQPSHRFFVLTGGYEAFAAFHPLTGDNLKGAGVCNDGFALGGLFRCAWINPLSYLVTRFLCLVSCLGGAHFRIDTEG